ncbi:unknown [Salmonella phage FelixO1]|uniref:Uncharacterized protein n=1 Tax=Salmonella phage Felix O1 (isolate Felix O1-VT1) TaxID=1283336 RepID=Q6KGK3_BPFO1|nr:unknown [Salmonella phage FelixO1]
MRRKDIYLLDSDGWRPMTTQLMVMKVTLKDGLRLERLVSWVSTCRESDGSGETKLITYLTMY